MVHTDVDPASAESAPRHPWTGGPAGYAATALGGLGLSAWEGTQWRSSSAAEVGVGVAIALTVTAAIVAGRRMSGPVRGRRHPDDLLSPVVHSRAGATAWGALVAVTVGWDLTCFLLQRHSLPTLSRLCGDLSAHQWGRALLFAAWLLLGAVLALGWRRRTSGPRPATTGPATDSTATDSTASDSSASDSTATVDR